MRETSSLTQALISNLPHAAGRFRVVAAAGRFAGAAAGRFAGAAARRFAGGVFLFAAAVAFALGFVGAIDPSGSVAACDPSSGMEDCDRLWFPG